MKIRIPISLLLVFGLFLLLTTVQAMTKYYDDFCNIDDEKCDKGCIIQAECDRECYLPGVNDVCNPYCVDKNGDDVYNREDLDGICDPDCYNNVKDQVYDPDCVESGDAVCDPDSHNVKDGICDDDCLGTNGVCDPDCRFYDFDCPHENNGYCEPPLGESCLNTNDCSCKASPSGNEVCCPDAGIVDEFGCSLGGLVSGEPCTCNAECSSDNCDSVDGENDHCCATEEIWDEATDSCVPGCVDACDTAWECQIGCDTCTRSDCSNNAQCDYRIPDAEQCDTVTDECACQNSPSAKSACCPSSFTFQPDAWGCVEGGLISQEKCACDTECTSGFCCSGLCSDEQNTKDEGQLCICDGECKEDLLCKESLVRQEMRCCPEGERWNGTACEVAEILDIVIAPANYALPGDRPAYEKQAKVIEESFLRESPFRECAQPEKRVRFILLENDCTAAISPCSSGGQWPVCTSACRKAFRDCVINEGFEGVFDKIIGVYRGSFPGNVLGCTQLNSDVGVHETGRGNSQGLGSVHEFGHQNGLCDEAYNNAPCAGGGGCCDPRSGIKCPNCPDNNCIMYAGGGMQYYADDDFTHLKDRFAPYMVGCGT